MIEIPGEAVTAIAVGIAGVLAAFAYAIRRSASSTDRRVSAAQEQHRKAIADSETRCRDEAKQLVARVQYLENQARVDGRNDRDRLLDIIAQHGEATRTAATINADGQKTLAKAVETLAKHLPDATPPTGSQRPT